MVSLPDLTGLGWATVRALTKALAASEPVEELVEVVVPLLDAPDVPRRRLAVYLLGFASGRRPARHLADPRAAFTYRRVLAPR